MVYRSQENNVIGLEKIANIDLSKIDLYMVIKAFITWNKRCYLVDKGNGNHDK